MRITLQAVDKDGVRACFNVVVDPEWLALDREDIDKAKTFHPTEITRLAVSYDTIERGGLVMGEYLLQPMQSIRG